MSMERKKVTGKQYVTRAELLDFNARVCELSARCAAWEKARERLGQALRAAGRDQAEAAAIVARLKAARQGKPADELAVYDEVKGLYAGLVRDGRKEFESDLVALCGEKALVHMRAGDAPGAIQEYNQAIAIQERLNIAGGAATRLTVSDDAVRARPGKTVSGTTAGRASSLTSHLHRIVKWPGSSSGRPASTSPP